MLGIKTTTPFTDAILLFNLFVRDKQYPSAYKLLSLSSLFLSSLVGRIVSKTGCVAIYQIFLNFLDST